MCIFITNPVFSILMHISVIQFRYLLNDNCILNTFKQELSFFYQRFFRNQPIRNKNCLWWLCLLTNRDTMSNLYRGPSIDASYQVSVHLAKRFQRRRFKKNRPIRNKNCMWRQSLLMDRDEMSNHYRGPSIDASYQVAVHLDEGFQRRRLKCEKLTDDGREVMAKAHLAFGKLS